VNSLETDRTYLRPLTVDDIDNVMRIFSDIEAMRFSPAETTQNRDDAEAFLKWNNQSYEQHSLGIWGVVSKSTGEYLGQSGLVPQDMGVEVFYSFVREHWGQGLATEVASAVRDFAFQELKHNRLIAIIHPDNRRAINVALKLGMKDTSAIEYWGRVNRLFQIESNQM
jgi:RimJ/RimL family protein N-acetyltransferase